MDLNMAFAKNWDRKNPSDFVKACDHSRQLREDEEQRQKNNQKFFESVKIETPKEKTPREPAQTS